ncbi:uncharacterized protein [Diabrotica undecimpunctata]|uniref:uncharacterized protein n=1 Tax=Diabrotica undecimpunctata TaxID=50387 RepID=UPI003B635CD3
MENSEENNTTKPEFLLTPEVAKNLKCTFCSLYLSYPPIIIMPTQEESKVKYKCGRCSLKTRFNFRNSLYEDLAAYMKFPCIFKGCSETVDLESVRDHEKDCQHRTIPCLASDCKEAVLETDFASHFKEKHKKLYHSEKIYIESFHGSGLAVLEKDNVCYILFYDLNIDTYRLALCGIKNNDKQFEIVLKAKDSKNSIHLTENNIVMHNDRVYCYRCLKGDCKYEYHLHSHYRRGMLKYANAKIEKYILKRTFGSDYSCTINVVEVKAENDNDLEDLLLGKDVVIDEVTEEDEIEEEKPSEPTKADALKNFLKCPGCEIPFTEPIFQCLNGHALCKECKEKADGDGSKCFFCDAHIETTRNYIIEETITNLKLNKDSPNTFQDAEVVCPTSKCHQKVKLSAISTHFKESHIENFHFNKFYLKNVYGYYNVEVLVKNEKTYLLFFDFNEQQFGVSVCSIEDTDETFDLKLLSENKKYFILAEDQKIIKFNDKEHCFKCSRGTCKITDHIYRVKRKEVFRRLTTKLNRDSVRRSFRTDSLNYQIVLKEYKEDKTDKLIKQLFECPICKDYMVPPIHQCKAGHTLCNVCKAKVEKCPSCEGSIEDTRNFILEDIAEGVEIPCSFESKSCNFRSGVKRMAKHELECPLNNKRRCVEEPKPSKDEDKPKEDSTANSTEVTNNSQEETTNSEDLVELSLV